MKAHEYCAQSEEGRNPCEASAMSRRGSEAGLQTEEPATAPSCYSYPFFFFASGDCCCLDSVGSSASTSTLSSPLISQKSAQRAQLVRASPRATQNFVPADNRSQHWESGWNCIAHSLYASLRWRADQRLTFKLKMKKQFSFIGGKKSISINIFHMYRCSSVNVASRN